MHHRHKVAIGWIDPGVCDGEFALSVLQVFRQRPRLAQIIRVEGGLISRMRNEVVAAFLDGDCDWLFMVDSDERFTVADFDKLCDTAHEKLRPFVAGLYFGVWAGGGDIYPQPVPLIFHHSADTTKYVSLNDYPLDQVIPVVAAGTGCLLVHRSVFEAIRTKHATPHTGDRWCWFMDMPVNGAWFGEDMYFCRQVEMLGFPMVANTGVVLGHRKRFWLTDEHHDRYRTLIGAPRNAEPDRTAAGGPGESDPIR
jgi:hypothetical protein